MHPSDAGARGLSDGDAAYVYNDFGCTRIMIRVTASIRRGVVSLPQGGWYRASETETYNAFFDADGDGVPERREVPVDIAGSVNVLTEDVNSGVVDPFFDGMGMNAGATLCEVSRVLPDWEGP